MFLMWLGNRLPRAALVTGISLIILSAGIVAASADSRSRTLELGRTGAPLDRLDHCGDPWLPSPSFAFIVVYRPVPSGNLLIQYPSARSVRG